MDCGRRSIGTLRLKPIASELPEPRSSRPAISTVHLVYPHGPQINAPHAIGRSLGARLERDYRVVYHDWDASYSISPQPDAVLLGHAHPRRGTVFELSSRDPAWRRVLMMSPYNGEIAQVAFLDPIIRRADMYLAITGEYWFSRVGHSDCSHWLPKMVRLDLAVDRRDYPPVKVAFNPPGKRRFVYIGDGFRMKNLPYLSAIARSQHGTEFAWIGRGGPRSLPGVTRLGWQDFSDQAARQLIGGFDFLITVGWADANPTTILEAMAWGLIPVCTPHSGYEAMPGIFNVPLDDVAGAAEVIRRLQATSAPELQALQRQNWDALDSHFNWDRFSREVVGAIESGSSPALGREGRIRRARLAWAAATSYHTSPRRSALRNAPARLGRASLGLLPSSLRVRLKKAGRRLVE
jgi:hypothetical protein